jgi:predicted transcriptional regulator
MRKSKLELYEEILSTLSDGQLSIDSIASQCNIDYATVTDLVAFLEKNQLVENNHDYAKKRYSLTKRGKEVYNSLAKSKRINEMQKSLTNTKEDQLSFPSLAEFKEFVPSLTEFKEFARNRLLARHRSRH